MPSDHTIVISGRYTARDDPSAASRKVLVEAARLTLAHGFRYFRISGSPVTSTRHALPSILPGANVVIEVYREGEVNPERPDVWDAEDVGTGLPSNREGS
jgi:hypothetical protein